MSERPADPPHAARPLDAARVRGPSGAALELRAWGAVDADGPWEPLSSALDARAAAGWDHGPLAWDPDAPAEGLCALSLYEEATYLATLPAGAAWGGPVARHATRILGGEGRAGVWALDLKGHAGRARLAAERGGAALVAVDVEVRTRKVEYLADWRAMLDALARVDLRLAVAERGPTDAPWGAATASREARAWEDFVLLRHLVDAGVLAEACAQIARAPVEGLGAQRRLVPAHLARHPLPDDIAAGPARGPSWERGVASTRDVPENRFVLRALEVFEARARELATPAGGLDATLAPACARVAHALASAREDLCAGPFAGLRASHAPAASQSLQRRRGYRDVLAAWALLGAPSEVRPRDEGPRLVVRDAPGLYERWCLCALGEALALDDAALALLLRAGSAAAAIEGREARVRAQRAYGRGESYSTGMRPDVTVECAGRRLLLDAKYQLDVPRAAGDDAPRAGLLKMHAYRDAIAGSWGAYALYPGSEAAPLRFDAPGGGGVGAIPLRPSGANAATQRATLASLLRTFARAC